MRIDATRGVFFFLGVSSKLVHWFLRRFVALEDMVVRHIANEVVDIVVDDDHAISTFGAFLCVSPTFGLSAVVI